MNLKDLGRRMAEAVLEEREGRKMNYPTVAKTQDEDGKDRFFVEDDKGNWIAGPFDTREEADAQSHEHGPLHMDQRWPGDRRG
jgi:hypothetical protein